jgi:GTP-binding protein
LEHPLSTRPQIVALNKVDIVEQDQLMGLKKSFEKLGHKVFVVSGLSGYGLKELLFALKEMVDEGKENG